MKQVTNPWFKGESISEGKLTPVKDTAGNIVALVYRGDEHGNLITAAPDLLNAVTYTSDAIKRFISGADIDWREVSGVLDQALDRVEGGDQQQEAV